MSGKKKNFILGVVIAAALIAVDQLTKQLAALYLKEGPMVLWPGVFELYYHENSGAAFGIMQNMHIVFYTVTPLLVLAILWVLWRIPTGKHYHLLRVCAVGILAGAIGNLIDRVVHRYVIDFLYFSLINFPIFNVADIYVTLSTIILILAILFYYQESDFDFLTRRRNGGED